MTTLRVHVSQGQYFDLDLPDDVFEALLAYAHAHGLTLDQTFDKIIAEFAAAHPIPPKEQP